MISAVPASASHSQGKWCTVSDFCAISAKIPKHNKIEYCIALLCRYFIVAVQRSKIKQINSMCKGCKQMYFALHGWTNTFLKMKVVVYGALEVII